MSTTVFDKHPRPWKVLIEKEYDKPSCYGVVDANGGIIIETDAGFYQPDIETAELIVRLVNEYDPR